MGQVYRLTDVGPKFPPPMIADEFAVKADGEFIKQ